MLAGNVLTCAALIGANEGTLEDGGSGRGLAKLEVGDDLRLSGDGAAGLADAVDDVRVTTFFVHTDWALGFACCDFGARVDPVGPLGQQSDAIDRDWLPRRGHH